ncbi:MAG: hypothetical protein IKP16_06090 [Prevotella sp.]|nr:hypothetical protein [Prevotella sp.]
MTTEEFIAKAKAVHGDRYDYSKVEYINNSTPVVIVCSEHGAFEQRPHNHLNGNGCPKCARATQSARQAMNQEEWIERAKRIHQNKYDYSKVAYVNNHTPIRIICHIHGEFMQTPASHITGQGCPICGKNKIRLSQEEAKKRLSDKLSKFPYEVVEPFDYKGDRDTNVTIHCKTHDFTWTTSWHQLIYAGTNLIGGCPGCRTTYSKDVCYKAALNCNYRSEFAKRFKGEYFAALRNGWLDEICSHMIVVGNHYKRCIYAYEFPDIEGQNYVYVGLTDHIPQRDLVHGRKGAVYTFCKKHNVERPKPIQLTDYIDKEEAKEQEGIQLAKYVSKGWIPINRVKTGSLGGHLANDGFTFEECKVRGQKYSKRSDWKREDYPTYYIASKRGWIDKILKQSERFGNAKQKYWTEERIYEKALKYSTRSEFRKNEPSAYQQAYKLGISGKVYSHMKRKMDPTGFTVEIICHEIDKYETLTDFIANNPRMINWLYNHKVKLTDISDKPYKKRKGPSKPVHQFTLDGTYVRSYKSAREAAKDGFNYNSISAVCHGKLKSHKGYIFRFEKVF